MSLESLTARVKEHAPKLAGLGYRVKFELPEDGVIMIDGRTAPVAIGNDDGEADCTIKINEANLESLMSGALSPTLAYTLGQLKIDGSLGVALKLASMLDG